MTSISRLAIAATAAAVAVTLAAAPPMAQAARQFITVTLPANADLTTYGWCTALGCQQPLRLTEPDPAALYAAITAVPIDPPDNRRVAAIDSYGFGSLATTLAVRRLQNTTEAPGSTTVAAILLRTPTRPNGGLLTRVDPENATPASNFNAFGGGPPPGARVDTSFVDVAREYDGFADFRSWPNPFSVANAVAGALLLRNYNDTVAWQDPRCPGGTCTAPATWPVTLPSTTGDVHAIAQVPDPTDPSKTINVESPSPVGVAVIPASGDQTVYYTEITRLLPLLIPLQLPFDVINRVVNAASRGKVELHLINPLVQVLQPPLAILVNLGYTDVNPAAGYTRTLLRPGEGVPFGTLPSLTPAQWMDVPGAAGHALLAGIRNAVLNPFGVRDTPFGSSSSPALPTNSPPTQRNQAELAGSSPLAETRDRQTQASTQSRAPDDESRITLTVKSRLAGLPGSASSRRDVVGSPDANRVKTDPTSVTSAETNTVDRSGADLNSNTAPTSPGTHQGSSSPTGGGKPSNADSGRPTSGADDK